MTHTTYDAAAVRARRAGRAEMLTPQAKLVLEHMEETGSISNVEAHAVLRVRSVSRRVTELLDAGFDIRKEFKTDSQGQRYVRYHLVD